LVTLHFSPAPLPAFILKASRTSSLAEWAAASKVVDLAAARQRLRTVERDASSNVLNPET
jgi:hypothetical protein